ncbi:MAG: extracellular solute-binding protein [Defluviitaleaceae bacterium]|nr:extracellular solute-binding protein [Defluviitaleaceae bacterium]MCL2836565.1 extracellular solute-binding protein [Defluviitaleaceae bacterium]
MGKRILSMFITVAMMAMLFAACQADTPAAGAGDSSAPVELTAVFSINPEVVIENNPIFAIIEEKLNIKLIVEAPPQSGYGERVRMMVATGDMPDLLHYGADIFATQWAEEGLLLDVTELIANYPNLSANVTMEQFGDCIFLPDGRIYGVPRPNSYDKWGFLINKKWLDNLGLEPPRTIDEFIEVCRAFTFDDPTGTGAVTFGASLHGNQTSLDSGIWHLQNDFLSMAFNISSWHHGMPDVDGSAQLRPLKSGYADYMQLVRALYEEGIIDREFVTHSANENQEKFAMQRVGIIGASEGNYIPNIIERFGLELDDYIFMPPLVRSLEDRPQYAMPPSCWMAYYVNANTTPERQDAALRLLDFANSEEGFVLLQMGIQGVHYNSYDIVNRTVDRAPEQLAARERATSNNFAMANAFEGRPPLQGGATPEQIAKWQVEAGFADSVTTKVYFGFTKMLDRIGVEFPDEVMTLNSLEVRYITGEVQLPALLDYISNTYAPRTAAIAQELADFMAANPARFVD